MKNAATSFAFSDHLAACDWSHAVVAERRVRRRVLQVVHHIVELILRFLGLVVVWTWQLIIVSGAPTKLERHEWQVETFHSAVAPKEDA